MGKTKTKFIDDSQPVEVDKTKPEPNRTQDKPFGRTQDRLVEKLKAELGIESENQPTEKADSVAPKTESPARQKKTPSKSKPRSKKYQETSKNLDRSKTYPINEAIELTRKLSYSKFTGVLEAHINTHQTGIRGLVSLPFSTGKKLRILAFGPSTSLRIDEEVTIGNDETIEQISKGKIDFDLVVTTAYWMPKLARVAKILGPRGLMPNPKNGTITDDLKKAVESFQAGKTEFKTENKASVIHLGIGKLSQPNEELVANVKTLLSAIGKTKIKKITLSPTMGPSVRIDLTSI